MSQIDARIAGNIYSLPGQIVSFLAGVAISIGQPVYISGDMTVSVANDHTHPTIGIAVTNASVGKAVSVLISCPIVYVVAEHALSPGAWVFADSGKVLAVAIADQPVNEAGSATYTFKATNVIGIALETASGDNAIIRIAVMHSVVFSTSY